MLRSFHLREKEDQSLHRVVGTWVWYLDQLCSHQPIEDALRSKGLAITELIIDPGLECSERVPGGPFDPKFRVAAAAEFEGLHSGFKGILTTSVELFLGILRLTGVRPTVQELSKTGEERAFYDIRKPQAARSKKPFSEKWQTDRLRARFTPEANEWAWDDERVNKWKEKLRSLLHNEQTRP